ncbi:MAG TPA: DUF4260 family protein [Acidobacteriaceae bacterium]|jgi:hypothetical protein|nr:DUF4260 family protein [Acidobacteriaceae bacterium]
MLTRPDVLLRLESLLVLSASVMVYRMTFHGPWWLLAVLFLAPDLSLAGYGAQGHARFAAMVYNTAHNYILPALLGGAGWHWGNLRAEQIAGIWIAHVAFDRVLGYGLKFPEGFKPTHIQSAGVYLAGEPDVVAAG